MKAQPRADGSSAEVPASLCAALLDARHVVVFTGAGVSAESGIPTFRDALTGLWETFDAEMLATPEAFLRGSTGMVMDRLIRTAWPSG
jgi:NAD-dependent SIR2 family protein deacetylase